MKILLVNDYKTIIGGTEIYLYALKGELEKRGHIVEVFGTNFSKEEYVFFQRNTSREYLLKQLFNLNAYREFKQTINTFKPDIINIHNIFYQLSPAILLAKNNIPIVMTVHDLKLACPVSVQSERTGKPCKNKICRGCSNCIGVRGSIYEFIKRIIHTPPLKKIDVFVGNSQYTNNVINYIKIGKTVNIRYCARLLTYKPITKNENILYLGRLTKEKGVEYVIQALPDILKVFPNTKLTIVGEGEEKTNLQNLTKTLNLEHHVIFKDFIQHTETQKYYENATIVTIPSTWEEPFGQVGIEAMSVGRPVIASRVGGIPEWLNDRQTGFLVEPKNAKQISEKVIKLFSNQKLLNFMGKNARKESEKFALEKHVDQIEKLYKKLTK